MTNEKDQISSNTISLTIIGQHPTSLTQHNMRLEHSALYYSVIKGFDVRKVLKIKVPKVIRISIYSLE